MVTPMSARNASRPLSTRSDRAFSFAEEKTGEADSDYEDATYEIEQMAIEASLDTIKASGNSLK